VPIVYAETRTLAEEWTYRYLAAAHLCHRVPAPSDTMIGTWWPAEPFDTDLIG